MRCSRCGAEKPCEQFTRDRSRKRGYKSWCRECDNRRSREAYAKKIGRRPNSYGIGLSKKKPCVDCGKSIAAISTRCRTCHNRMINATRTAVTRDAPCKFAGCTAHRGKWGRKGYCTKHYQQFFKTHRGNSRRLNGGNSERYTRQEVYLRDGGRCRYCGRRVGKKWHLAHLVALAQGGSDVLSNVAVSCPSCNLRDGTGRLAVQMHIAA